MQNYCTPGQIKYLTDPLQERNLEKHIYLMGSCFTSGNIFSYFINVVITACVNNNKKKTPLKLLKLVT